MPAQTKPALVPATLAPAPPPKAPAAAQWTPVPESSAAGGPAAAPTDLWVDRATTRRGQPVLQAVGWALAGVGLLVTVAGYFQGYRTGTIPDPGRIRLDFAGAVLSAIGFVLAIAFSFAPNKRSTDVLIDPTAEELERRARAAHQRVRTAQVLVGVGLMFVFAGLGWLTYWMYTGYMDGRFRDTVVQNYAVPTHYFGAILLLLGLLITLAFWSRVAPARAQRAYIVVALKRAGAGRPAGTLASGVTDAEVQALMRRLDGLMAQLPDAAVTEFSKTPEADTYLKLLGS